ncbi:MAG: hypothetical protein ACRDPI_07960 [Nocardioidaceae bacterium]
MELLQFHKMRTAVQVNAYPASGADVATFEGAVRDMLMSSGIFDSVEVETTDDPDQLVIALCQFRAEFDQSDVAGQLERLWDQRARYPFWEAHTTLIDEEAVEFEGATRLSDTGHYVTVHLIAQRGRIPSQRVSTD